MATTYKLYLATNADGSAYIDLPISGRISSVVFNRSIIAGAGGVAVGELELSRVAVNQFATNNPRGVICGAPIATAAASQGAFVSTTVFPDEQVKSGERLYLNAGGVALNITTTYATCYITIV